MRRLLLPLLLLLAACSPVTGVFDDAAPDVGLDAAPPPDAPPEAAQPDDGPEVIPEASVPDGPACEDRDRDGHGAVPCGDDCDDTNAMVHPDQPPLCSATIADSDCNGTRDALEPARRGGRCSQEAEALGLPSTTVRSAICIMTGSAGRCAACEGSGAARRCVCWENSSRAYQECSL